VISNAYAIYRKEVIHLLAKTLDCDEDEKILNRTNPSWDSLKQLQISLEIEDRFNIELSDEQATKFFDVDSVLQILVELNFDEN
jgi:acyl carrier protein